jgi:hypothetical protein
MIIDIHAHYLPQLLYQRFDAEAVNFPGVQLLRGEKGIRLRFAGGEATRPISPTLSDLAERRGWLDRNGIDHQLVGGWRAISPSRRASTPTRARASRPCISTALCSTRMRYASSPARPARPESCSDPTCRFRWVTWSRARWCKRRAWASRNAQRSSVATRRAYFASGPIAGAGAEEASCNTVRAVGADRYEMGLKERR